MLLLSGCGQAQPQGGGATAVAPTTASQPADAPQGDQAPHYAENHRYRERVAVTAAAQRVLDAARVDVLARLRALPDPPTPDSVTSVLATKGDDPWVAEDGRGGVAFESQVGQAGCLIGSVSEDGGATVDTGGFIMDGGCHALTGH